MKSEPLLPNIKELNEYQDEKFQTQNHKDEEDGESSQRTVIINNLDLTEPKRTKNTSMKRGKPKKMKVSSGTGGATSYFYR